ncbi:ribonuclease D [Marinomonas mediterranea]|jgi:ribonuclease D|uniref:Ribonuclease D n=1 Tax=Marinomonas mediterranea (strain ATCC 700492 / JCM 21426 / NBRC 103028 / MMB-1) TaxID=717774 RepID=F2JU75_MARM1|nr:ribonuclease D [Marinomonas mediterranea]ADZ91587.1 ribonuclease D [Marinomonas mediterranea MMB-1]WCN13627.1 ribonuclease D [Marinomonas mediterranea]WCN17690.1 ribonuclease D [Marinomonas mediterranea MMB-1]
MTIVDQSYDIVWVETDAELASWCEYWSTLNVIAVDTEFLRRTTYYPITGLIQISEGEKAVLIDPQTITEWAPLKDLMVNLDVMKVFHACSEDLDVFDRLLGVLPTPFYDTQIGEAYANGQWSVSYVKLIQAYLSIEVAKDETRSDWTVRPLTEAQKRYAALDVVYLAKVYPQQIEMLQKKNMLDWALEDCDTLKWQYMQNGDPEQNWSNVKAAWRLSPKSLTLLRMLFIWREEQAKSEDVPKGQVLKDRSLWAIAKFMPDHHKAISKTEDLTGKQHRLYGDTILEKVKVIKSLSEDEYQLMLPMPLPSQAGELSKSIKSYIRKRSEELGVAPEAVMKRKLLDPIVRHLYEGGELDWSNPAMVGWRKDTIIEPILSNFGEQSSN